MSKSLKNATLIVMLFSVITRIMGFCFKIYLSRVVGAEVMGLYQICLSVFFMFLTLACSGIPLTLSRLTAEYSAMGKKKGIFGIVSSAMLISLGVVAVLLLCYYLLSPYLGFLFQDPRCVPLFKLMLPALITSSVYMTVRGYFMGKKKYALFSVTELVEESVKVVLTLVLLSDLFLISQETALGITFLVTDIISALFVLFLYFLGKGRFSRPQGTAMLIRASLPITVTRILSSLSATLTATIVPERLVQSGFTIAEATRLFGMAMGMAMPLIMAPLSLTSSVSVVLLPEIAEEGARGDKEALERKLDKAVRFALATGMLFIALYMALGREIGLLLFREAEAGSFLAVTSGMILPMSMSGIFSTAMNSLGKEKRGFIHFVVALAVMVVLIFVLPKFCGIYSLGIAQAAYYTISMTLNLAYLCRAKIMSLRFFGAFLKSFVAAALAFVAYKALYSLLATLLSPLVSLLIAVLLGVAVYGVLAVGLKILDIKAVLVFRR